MNDIICRSSIRGPGGRPAAWEHRLEMPARILFSSSVLVVAGAAVGDGGNPKGIDWYSELPVTAASLEFAQTSGLVDGIMPCCNLLQINCTTGTLQHDPSAYNFSVFAPFAAAGKRVSVSLEGTGGMADCCANATHCPMLRSKDTLAQQLLGLALKYQLSGFTGDWEFGRGDPVAFYWHGWNQTMAHIASVLKPHGVGLGNSISSGCFAYDELTATRCGPDGGHADPCCCPASRDVPWADVLTDMYSYSIHGEDPAWQKNGTRGSCGPLLSHEDPATQQYCGWEGPLMNTLHSPVATVHADRVPQLSPALWLGDCLENGTSVHGWTQEKLASFLGFLDTQGITRIGVWCMTDGHDPIGFPCPGVESNCSWQYDELLKWKARATGGVVATAEEV
jgi:hypothetical protein